MKILHITPTLFPSIGGIETVVRELMLNLRRRGFEADAMQIAPGIRRLRERLDESTVWRVPLYPNHLVGIISRVRSIFLEYDVLHVHDPQLMAVSANVLLQGRGRKIVLSTHGGYGHTGRYGWGKSVHWKCLAPLVLSRYDRVLASSHSDHALFKTKVANIQLVPNGVGVEKFLTAELSSECDPRRWIYWGRLSGNKRLDLVIELVAQARERGLLIDLLIVGRDFDRLEPALLAQIERIGLERQVKLAGLLSHRELMREIAGRTVFVTASEYEGFGLSVIEAMAAGLIVVCRDVPPLNDFVSPGENGVLLQFDQSDSDLSAIRKLCEISNGELLCMRKKARLAAEAHSWDSAVLRYIDVYEGLMHDSGTRDARGPAI